MPLNLQWPQFPSVYYEHKVHGLRTHCFEREKGHSIYGSIVRLGIWGALATQASKTKEGHQWRPVPNISISMGMDPGGFCLYIFHKQN